MGATSTPPAEPESFATTADVTARGYTVATGDEAVWDVVLGDVSDALRARGRRVGYDLDAAIDAGKVTKRTATRVTVAITQRFKDRPTGPQTSQQTFGPFSRSFTPADVAMYARADELADLGIPTAPPPRGTFGDNPAVPDVLSPGRGSCSTPV